MTHDHFAYLYTVVLHTKSPRPQTLWIPFQQEREDVQHSSLRSRSNHAFNRDEFANQMTNGIVASDLHGTIMIDQNSKHPKCYALVCAGRCQPPDLAQKAYESSTGLRQARASLSLVVGCSSYRNQGPMLFHAFPRFTPHWDQKSIFHLLFARY